MTRRLRALFDCDGILCDFLTPSFTILNRLYKTEYTPADLKDWDILSLYGDKHVDKFYRIINSPGHCVRMPPYPEAIKGLSKVQEIADVYIVTTPIHHHLPAKERAFIRFLPKRLQRWFETRSTWTSERESWLHSIFQIPRKRVVHTAAKYLCVGDVFMDDLLSHVVKWKAAHPGGLALLWDPRRMYKDVPEGIVVVWDWDTVYDLISKIELK